MIISLGLGLGLKGSSIGQLQAGLLRIRSAEVHNMLVDELMGDMMGSGFVDDPSICDRGCRFLATRHENVKCMPTSI